MRYYTDIMKIFVEYRYLTSNTIIVFGFRFCVYRYRISVLVPDLYNTEKLIYYRYFSYHVTFLNIK